jgi:hypothetical protein
MMKTYVLPLFVAASASLVFSTGAAALGNLENPQPGGIETGIGAVTGWHCTSRNIEVRIDGASAGLAGTGTSREDTASVCGGRSDTGFSLLLNYSSLLRGGTHKVDVYADGVLFGSASFTVGYLGAEFLSGLTAAHRIPDFPVRGQGARVVWQQSKQNFVIAGMEAMTSGSLVGSYSIRNIWMQESTGLAMSTLASGVSASGNWTLRANGTYTMTLTLEANDQSQTTSISGRYFDGGYYILEADEIMLIIERGDTLTVMGLAPTDESSWAALTISATRNQGTDMAEAPAADIEPLPSHTTSTGSGGTLQAIGAAFRGLAR